MATEIQEPVKIAYCSEHGLHGQRDTCFECGLPCQQIPVVQASRLAGVQLKLAALGALVDGQANDAGLWFEAETAPEAYLQAELRKLHVLIEA